MKAEGDLGWLRRYYSTYCCARLSPRPSEGAYDQAKVSPEARPGDDRATREETPLL